MNAVPLQFAYDPSRRPCCATASVGVDTGVSLLKKNCLLLGPYGRPMPMVVLRGGAVSYARGTPAHDGRVAIQKVICPLMREGVLY